MPHSLIFLAVFGFQYLVSGIGLLPVADFLAELCLEEFRGTHAEHAFDKPFFDAFFALVGVVGVEDVFVLAGDFGPGEDGGDKGGEAVAAED